MSRKSIFVVAIVAVVIVFILILIGRSCSEDTAQTASPPPLQIPFALKNSPFQSGEFTQTMLSTPDCSEIRFALKNGQIENVSMLFQGLDYAAMLSRLNAMLGLPQIEGGAAKVTIWRLDAMKSAVMLTNNGAEHTPMVVVVPMK